jgi:phosphatidate cytidylyltransferase
MNNLIQRIISAVVMILFVFISAVYFPKIFLISLVLISGLMYYEWINVVKKSQKKTHWHVAGLIYCLSFIVSIFVIYSNGYLALFYLILVVMTFDIFALSCGKIIGGKKLAPKISPNKTWSGFFGGVIFSVVAGYYFYQHFIENNIFGLYFSIFISIFAQIGDLFESKIKRIFQVKDSGTLIPGHGGFLDRLDGFIFVSPIFAIYLCLI